MQRTVMRIKDQVATASRERITIPPITRCKGGSFGFNLAHSALTGELVFAAIAEDGVSKGCVEVGDVLRVVNGTNVKGLEHRYINLLISSSQSIQLEVDRHSSLKLEIAAHDQQVQQVSLIMMRTAAIEYGIQLAPGGADNITSVAKLQPGGVARQSQVLTSRPFLSKWRKIWI